jgi:phosphodiesterase/alkaline phosphatase D-like protein
MAKLNQPEKLPAQYRNLRQRLAKVGWLALGSLLERKQPGQGGPRYQWSRRVGAKTVTVALSAEQFAWLKTAVTNQRAVWQILLQMQTLTVKHMLQNLPNPPRRKRLTHKHLGLN